jgi:hypothetical protein
MLDGGMIVERDVAVHPLTVARREVELKLEGERGPNADAGCGASSQL